MKIFNKQIIIKKIFNISHKLIKKLKIKFKFK